MAKPAAQMFGKYQILERVATGGMAEIYKARHEGIGGFQRTLAIKRILPNLSQNSDYIAMLVDEAKVAGLLSHANIVQILDLGQVDDIWYIAMEYVEGTDLGAVLRRARDKGQRLPVPHAVFVAMELLKGLEYAHQRQVMRGAKAVALNIIHRDISPPNILLSYKGEVKLTDFGIARAALRVMETVSGIVKGRFDYMSPEQADGRKDLDQRSDLFSVGVVLYEMLTGEHPFRADNELATIEKVRAGDYIPVATRNPDVPFALQAVVDRALRANRDERYPTATAFKENLDRFFHESEFIFNHGTLASYMHLLFPEAAPKKKLQEPIRPIRKRLGHRDEEVEDDEPPHAEAPTGMIERQQRATPAPAQRAEDVEATAIRSNPLLTQGKNLSAQVSSLSPQALSPMRDDHDTLIGRVGDEEQETVIRRSPFADELSDGLHTNPSVHVDESVHRDTHSGGQSGDTLRRRSLNPLDVRSSGGFASSPSGAAAVHIGWLGWVLSFLLLGVGVLVGSTVAGSATWALMRSAAPNQLATLTVSVPSKTSVLLDGDGIGGEIQLPPGKAHMLEVRVDGSPPWKRVIELKPGEQRMIVVEQVRVDRE